MTLRGEYYPTSFGRVVVVELRSHTTAGPFSERQAHHGPNLSTALDRNRSRHRQENQTAINDLAYPLLPSIGRTCPRQRLHRQTRDGEAGVGPGTPSGARRRGLGGRDGRTRQEAP